MKRFILAMIIILTVGIASALEVYEKVSDTEMGIIRTEPLIIKVTLGEINKAITEKEKQLARLDVEYNQQKVIWQNELNIYKNWKLEAEKIGLKNLPPLGGQK